MLVALRDPLPIEALQHDLAAIVVNFVDILAHSRSDTAILKEIAPDVPAYRGLTATWFEHSWLYQAFQELARQDVTIVITSDHGVIRSLHATKVIGVAPVKDHNLCRASMTTKNWYGLLGGRRNQFHQDCALHQVEYPFGPEHTFAREHHHA